MLVFGVMVRRVNTSIQSLQDTAVQQKTVALHMRADLLAAEAALYRFQIEGLTTHANQFDSLMADYERAVTEFEMLARNEQERAWAQQLADGHQQASMLGQQLITLRDEQAEDLANLEPINSLARTLLTQLRLSNTENLSYQSLANQLSLDLNDAFFAVASYQQLPDNAYNTIFKTAMFTLRFHQRQMLTLDLSPEETQPIAQFSTAINQIETAGLTIIEQRDEQQHIFNEFVALSEQLGQTVIANEIQPYTQSNLTQAEENLVGSLRRSFIISSILVAFSVITAFAITIPNLRDISGAMQQLSVGVQRIAAGDLTQPIVTKGSSELAQLGHTFNKMMEDLSERERRLERRISELDTLRQMNLGLIGTINEEDLWKTIVESACTLFDAAEARVFIQTTGDPAFEKIASTNSQTFVSDTEFQAEMELVNTAKQTQHFEVVNHAQDNSRYRNQQWVSGIVHAHAAAPLTRNGELLGVLSIFLDDRNEFTQGDIRALRLLADQAAVAIENLRLFKKVTEKENHLNALLQKLALVQEEERRLVGLDLHDGVTQILLSLHMHLNAFTAFAPTLNTAAQKELENCKSRLQEAIAEVGWVISELRPTELEDFGLIAGLRQYTEKIAEAENWTVDFQLSELRTLLAASIETAIFRIVQEGLSNARKYAQTERLRVSVQSKNGVIIAEVQDYGVGFNIDQLPADTQSLGLLGMRERAELIGGTFNIRSVVGEGTTLTLSLPQQSDAPQPPIAIPNDTIHVYIVDDHAMVREGLKSMLIAPNISVVGEADNSDTAINNILRLKPDVVFIDIQIPSVDGITTIKNLRSAGSASKFIVFTTHRNASYLLRSVAAGAAAFLLKNVSHEELLTTLYTVSRGELRLETEFFQRVLRQLNDTPMEDSHYAQFADLLTPREKDVLQLLIEGLTYGAIATALGITTNTVKGYVKTIFQKLEVSDRTQAAVKALRYGIVK